MRFQSKAAAVIAMCVLVSVVDGGKILVKPWGAGTRSSHLFLMDKIARILALDGHDVKLLLGSVERDVALGDGFLSTHSDDLLTFNTTGSVTEDDEKLMRDYLLKFGEWFSLFTLVNSYSEKRFCDLITAEPGLLGKIKDGGFDYVIIDHVDACGRLLANYVGKPFAILHSFPSNTIIYGEGGSPLVLSYTPTHGVYRATYFSDKMTFLERVHNVLHYVIEKMFVHVTLERTMNAFGWSHGLLQAHERYESIISRAALVLSSSNPAFDHPRPTMPNVQHIGGHLCQPAKALPQKLDHLLAKSAKKVIYMSFGTLIHGPGGIDENQRFKTALLGAVSNLPYLFIIANFNMTGLPTNVVTLEWAPQNDLLAHSKIDAFFTHGGLNGLWQAICHATPVVVMPIFADQFRNAHMVQERGIGEMIDFHTITTESLQSALRRVVENNAYAARMRQLSKLYHHSLPMSSDETVSFWVNYTMLYTDQQAPAFTELNFLQYWLIDITACLLVVLAISAWLTCIAIARTALICYHLYMKGPCSIFKDILGKYQVTVNRGKIEYHNLATPEGYSTIVKPRYLRSFTRQAQLPHYSKLALVYYSHTRRQTKRKELAMRLQSKAATVIAMCVLVFVVDGGKILIKPWAGTTPSSHHIIMDKIAKILARDGHDVTFLLGSKEREVARNGGFLSTDSYDLLTFNTTGLHEEENKKAMRNYLVEYGNMFVLFMLINAKTERRVGERIVAEPDLLHKIKDGGFDYVIIDQSDAVGHLLANYVNKPFAIVHNLPSNTIIYGEGGSPLVLSYTPTHGVYRTAHFSDKMTFLERVHNVLHYVIDKVLVHVTLERSMNAFGWSHGLLQSHERYEGITDRAALVLCSSNPAFDHPRPTMPNVQHIGGQLCQPVKALPQKLDDLLARTNRKVIYMSFGTLLHGPGGLNENQRFKTALLGAVSNLPYLFIIANFNMTGLPTNVVTLEWAPQNDLLGHSKVASFITHGGINGLWQAICHATPVVVMPIFADQFRNAHMAQERGIGEMIDFHTITTASLQSALRRVVENNAYAARVRQLSKLYHHSLPMSPDETVSFWVNYTMLYADQQAPAYTELNFLQYWLIDVIACLLVIAAFFAWLTYVVLIASISISTRDIRRCRRRDIRNIISA
ncbi:PREDICTED: uncharacterized protein LOC106809051 [Priapulus caudatus]|uniref:Uncharacterized protein LOC106809051 n=1 Tax=Priapulus caudatus TaxID=37621 RepID=A0ABM1E5P6_PRICU|nr:PREDICTED: uncharacterized protein LOC106809051 [Priapulus caudatus]